MATFQFRFETVLRQRRMIEDERQRDLAKLYRRRMILQNQIRHMQDTIRESKHELSDTLVGQVDLSRVGQFAAYSGQVASRAHEIVRELAKIEQEVDSARARLIEASRGRKAIELLRERHLAVFRTEQRRREERELDEVATQQYTRNYILGLAS